MQDEGHIAKLSCQFLNQYMLFYLRHTKDLMLLPNHQGKLPIMDYSNILHLENFQKYPDFDVDFDITK